ncbi:MAG: hypothetical protein V2A73_21990 [Pseudomonadota bacterium]
MSLRRRVARLDLSLVLLVIATIELILNRLAVPALRPPSSVQPPGWHRNLDMAGLFVFYLASVLGVAAIGWKTWDSLGGKARYPHRIRLLLGVAMMAFMLLAGMSVVMPASRALSLNVESGLAVLLLLTCLGAWLSGGDRRAQVGLVLLLAPFLLHYSTTVGLSFMGDDGTAAFSFLERMSQIGAIAIVASAILAPVCFAPAPLRSSLARPAPMAMAAFASTVGAVLLKRHYELGALIASRGLGLDLGPGAPQGTTLACIAGLAMLVWTLTATAMSSAASRRRVGAGLALVLVSGFSFAWPLQLLGIAVGMLVIAEASIVLPTEEAEANAELERPFLPRIRDDIWRGYVQELARAVEATETKTAIGGEDGESEETVLTGSRRDTPFSVRLERRHEAVTGLQLVFGSAEPAERQPTWLLSSRPEGFFGHGSHPEQPRISAPVAPTGDGVFDRRFRIQGNPATTAALLDADMRSSACAVLDGWVAVWPGSALVYRVNPGRNAPLHHPVPVTVLARHGGEQDPRMVEPLLCVMELLAAMAARALALPTD